MSFLVSIVAIGLLIALHEAGHFIAARRAGMTVIRYSIGLLHSIVSWTSKKTGTVYQIGVLPLGGFVQIKGMNPFEEGAFEDADSYQLSSIWRRGLVIVAGPLANLLVAWLVFFGLYIYGFPMRADEPRVGDVLDDSPAERAGLRDDDLIRAIDGQRISSIRGLVETLGEHPDEMVQLDVLRGGDQYTAHIVESGDAKSLGIVPSARQGEPRVGTVLPRLPAREAGIVTNDLIIAVNDKKTQTWPELVAELRKHPEQTIVLDIERAGEQLKLGATPKNVDGIGQIGIYSALSVDEARIGVVTPDSPAGRAGLKGDDLIISVDRIGVSSWEGLEKILAAPREKTISVTVQRGGEMLRSPAVPENQDGVGRIGISIAGSTVPLQPAPLHIAAANGALHCVAVVFRSMAGLIAWASGVEGMGDPMGPVKIVRTAAAELQTGVDVFLALVATLSLMLFLFNLLPLPALDGGRTIFLLYELITRRRVSPKVDAIVNAVGFVALLGLLVVITVKEIFIG